MKLNYTRKWHAKSRSARTPDGCMILDGPAKTVPLESCKVSSELRIETVKTGEVEAEKTEAEKIDGL